MTPVLAQAQTGGAAEFWVFVIVGAVALGSAIAMVLLRNAVHAALMLVVNFFTIAIFYAVLEAQFLAVIQIIVYAGAIMVLFLFVIMLLGVSKDGAARDDRRGSAGSRPSSSASCCSAGSPRASPRPSWGPPRCAGRARSPGTASSAAAWRRPTPTATSRASAGSAVHRLRLAVRGDERPARHRRNRRHRARPALERPEDLTDGETPVDEAALRQAGHSEALDRRSPTGRTRSPGERTP
jgi:hypothetical protein